MSGKSPLLRFTIRVITKAPLKLEMENERPYLLNSYLSNIRAETFAT